MRQKDTTPSDQLGVATKLPHPLPKTLPGSVCPQYVRCGKPTCACTSGTLHGPYYYRFWREKGRLHKQYIPTANVPEVQQACATYRQERRGTSLRNLLQMSQRHWHNLAKLIQESEHHA